MKRIRNTLIISLLCLKCFATHIVGGEIFLQPIQDNVFTHQITLNFYFDAINGNPSAEDLTVTLYFFRQKNDELVGTASLPRVYKDYIKYNTPACERADLKTLLIKYQTNITLSPENFSDPEGYYVTWERCCRNAVITNIKDPGGSGMVFYLQFPPVTTINTSPKFNDIIADYICINQQFLFDFSAFDPDGDSLSYQLITPWAGFTNRTVPIIQQSGSQNYPLVSWNTGYSLENVMGGDVPLKIDPVTGVLTIQNNKIGLFVFSVMVEEFRKGKKIGRVKRDFQIKVIDCLLNASPNLVVKDANTNNFYKDGDVILIKKNDKKCVNIAISDPDVGQTVILTAKSLNFDVSKINIASPNQITISKVGDSLKTQVCLDNCTISKNSDPITFALTVTDNGCPASLKTSVVIQVKFEDSQPLDPKVSTSLTDNNVSVNAGDTLQFKVNGEVVLNDSLLLSGASNGYVLKDLGMIFNDQSGVTKLSSNFVFVPNCTAVKAGKIPVLFTTKELRCGVSKQISTAVFITVIPIPNNPPRVATTLINNQATITLNPADAQVLTFNVFGQDVDNQQLTTSVLPNGFTLSSAGMAFSEVNGIKKTNGTFTWQPTCSLLNGQASKEYNLSFVTNDNACLQKQDSVKVKLILQDIIYTNNTYKPFNTFTPNGDGINDFFSLDNLPNDNCTRQFVRFEIFNRWGTQIFSTQDRHFRWSGDNFSAGDYFYALHFSDEIIKGIITMIR